MKPDLVEKAIALDKKIDQAILAKLPKYASKLKEKLACLIDDFSEVESIEWEEYIQKLENEAHINTY
jgi:hypothetical protein